MDRRLLLGGAAATAALAASGWWVSRSARGGPIRIGVLHSLTGTMAISESPLVDAITMALEELNAAGGLIGRQVEAVVVDGRSDADQFAKEAERLASDPEIAAIFGCWTSASRRTVRPVVERLGHLLFYPVQYEGLEDSPNIVYVGAAPNQQILPAVKWSFDHLGKRFFLAGSDYVFPRCANAIIRDHVASLRGEIVGEDYLLLGSADVAAMIEGIVRTKPDVILNTINGDSNVAFFEALRAAGITADQIPVVSFSIAEAELAHLSNDDLEGHYAAWNYFQTIDSDRNRAFVARWKDRFGSDRVTSDPIEAAYVAVQLWAQAVTEFGTADVAVIRDAIKKQSLAAPEGIVYVDPENRHTWKAVRIGRIRDDGQFDVVWSSEDPIRPLPFPLSRSRADWDAVLAELHGKWGGWANPGNPK